MSPFVLGLVLSSVQGGPTPILLRFRPTLGEPMAYRRTISGEFALIRGPRISISGRERTVEVATASVATYVTLRVLIKREPWELKINGEAMPLSVRKARFGDISAILDAHDPVMDEIATVQRDGRRGGLTQDLVLALLFPDLPFTGDTLLALPAAPIRTGALIQNDEVQGSPVAIRRFEATVRVADEDVALFSIRPLESIARRDRVVAPYGAFAVRVRDGVILRAILAVELSNVGIGFGTIRYDSALDGAPTWAQLNAEQWKDTLLTLPRRWSR